MAWTVRLRERFQSKVFDDLRFFWLYLRLNIPYIALCVVLCVLYAKDMPTVHSKLHGLSSIACILAVRTGRLPWQTLPNSAAILLHILQRHAWPAAASSSATACCIGFTLSFLSFFLFPLLSFAAPTGPYRHSLGTRHTLWSYPQHIAQEWEAPGVGLELHHDRLIPSQPSKSGRGRTYLRRLPVQVFYPAAPPSVSHGPHVVPQEAKGAYAALAGIWRSWMQVRAPTWTTGSPSSLYESTTLLHEFAIHLLEIPAWLGGGLWLSHLWLLPSPFVHGATMLQLPTKEDGTSHRWPVVLYSHGMFGWKTFNASIAAELASHGYVVLAVEHPGDCIVAVAGADRKTGGLLYPPQLHSLYCHTGRNGYVFSEQRLDDQWWTYHCNLRLRHEDILQVARRLMTLKEETSVDEVQAALSGRIDTSAFGLYGHSYGGGTAYTATCTHGIHGPLSSGDAPQGQGEEEEGKGQQMEPRFACMVGLDPWLWPVHPSMSSGGQHHLYWGLQGFRTEERACSQRVQDYTHSGALAQQAQALNTSLRSAPCLFLTSDGWMWQRWNMPLWQTVMARDPVLNRLVQVKWTSHLNFTDAILVASPHILRLSPGNGIGSSDPLRSSALQARLACTFLQAHLPTHLTSPGMSTCKESAVRGQWETVVQNAADGESIAREMEHAAVVRIPSPTCAIQARDSTSTAISTGGNVLRKQRRGSTVVR